MFQVLLSSIALILLSQGGLVWRARPSNPTNRWFAAFTVATALWILALVGAHSENYANLWARLTFASASIIPAAFLAFISYYPSRDPRPSARSLSLSFAVASSFAAFSLWTDLIIVSLNSINGELTRQTGLLYPAFVLYFLVCYTAAVAVMFGKWRTTHGAFRSQIQYLGTGLIVSGACAITTNLILPFLTGRSTYTWLGPVFGVVLISLIAHAIIRHRLMDLRIVIHRSLTLVIAMLVSLLPVLIVFAIFWPRLSDRFEFDELLLLLLALTFVCLLVPPTRDFVGRLLDKYLHRTRANYQRTVREASRALTRVLDLKLVLSFVSQALVIPTESEGVVIYLQSESGFSKRILEKGRGSGRIEGPDVAPDDIVAMITKSQDVLVTAELTRERNATRSLKNRLTQLNWSLVLPLLSEDKIIGFIAVGPKLSGDPFYPQDLDLLMTLTHQAGIAIKNAQLYTQVVLANEYIENIVRTIESGVVAVDEAGRVAMFNRAAEQLTGIDAAQVHHQSVDLLPPALATPLRGTVADGRERTEPEIALPNGEATRPVLCTTSPLRDQGGAVLGAVAVFSDLTPFKQLESERRRAERLAYFEILAASLAHEIRNPLVAIKAFAQLVPLRHRDEHFVEEFSRQVTRETARMERLVERLSALSGPSDRPKQPLDLREAIRQAVELMRPPFEEKSIAIASDPGPVPRTVLGDPHELEQLFLNLLMNAHEATPPGGTVVVGLAASDASVAVTVADSGPGIPPALLEHVFDPFITTKPRGSGLGLSICAGIAAAHRAKLRATNRPDGGALLTVEFPVSAPAESPREISRSG